MLQTHFVKIKVQGGNENAKVCMQCMWLHL